jgi:predicted nucleotidyltransferase component of viral defense system
MIPFDYITEWRSRAPWLSDVQVEQDLVLTRVVAEIFNREEVVRTVAFRGGTALYKLHLVPPARYSEDIDLVQTSAGPIGATLKAVRAALDPWLNAPKWTPKASRVTLVYRFASEGPPSIPLRLKIEINTREHFCVFPLEERRLEVASRWFSGSASVRTYALEELLGTKLRALYQRRKGRDLFDLYEANRRSRIDPARIVECFQRYMEHGGLRVSRAEFEANLHEKLAHEDFGRDVVPLLAPGVEWDRASAAGFVLNELVSRLPGEPWKGSQ